MVHLAEDWRDSVVGTSVWSFSVGKIGGDGMDFLG